MTPINVSGEDFAAEVVDLAYRRLLQQGLRQPFVDVELDLWRDIKALVSARTTDTSRAEVN